MKNKTTRLNLELLESRKLCAVDLGLDFETSPAAAYFASSVSYHNASKPADVDGDGAVSPIDALRLIDALNRNGSIHLASIQANRMASGAEGEQDPIGHVDTNNDGSLNPIDVLVVIDAINGDAASSDGAVPTAFSVMETEPTVESTFEFPSEEFAAFELIFGKILSSDSFDFTQYDPTRSEFSEDDFSHITEEEFDSVFGEVGFDPEWVMRSGLDEEVPMLFSEEFPTMNLEETDLSPIFMAMSNFINSLSSVALFSDKGLMGQVARQNAEQNTTVEMAPVTYFSSNFLRGNR